VAACGSPTGGWRWRTVRATGFGLCLSDDARRGVPTRCPQLLRGRVGAGRIGVSPIQARTTHARKQHTRAHTHTTHTHTHTHTHNTQHTHTHTHTCTHTRRTLLLRPIMHRYGLNYGVPSVEADSYQCEKGCADGSLSCAKPLPLTRPTNSTPDPKFDRAWITQV
jgi:hypothetical protein